MTNSLQPVALLRVFDILVEDSTERHYDAHAIGGRQLEPGNYYLVLRDAWQPIETAPEDTNILVATQGGWVDTAFWTDEDGEGRKWWWLVSANKHAEHPIHPDLVPTHWMPLPKHPNP